MKNLAKILVVFLFLPSFQPKGAFQEKEEFVKTIDVTEKSLAFSRYATPGKISVFIMAAHWCGPCKMLKEDFEAAFENKMFSAQDVEVYYCLVSKSNKDNLEILNKRKSYQNFKQIDNLTEVFPTSYITTPTTNCYAIIKGAETEKIFSYVKDLVELKHAYFTLSALNAQGPKTNDKISIKLQEEVDNLKEENDSLRDEISTLKEQLRRYRPPVVGR